ncbi:MAG: Omp28-related outer membrane protein [Tannerella sp.]|jgi:thiol-disulfide isomerase/thioredoxin|nr:Omp28-related outer membrane protein [Tannerella sp.]
MKRTEKNFLTIILCILSAVCLCNCSNNGNDPGPEPEIVVKIAADRTAIKANGNDAVTFTVTANDEAIVSDVYIICKNETNVTDTIKGSRFSTGEAGKYTFHASYKGRKSSEISIDASDVVLLLKADRSTVKANGRDVVLFTVTADGEDVTSSAVITVAGATDAVLDDASFATDAPSAYTFYATYDGAKSNEISVEAAELEYLLTVDRTTVKADGSEKATFSVMLDGEDITSAATIFQTVDGAETTLDVPEFITHSYGAYTFYALYDGKKTKEITVNATYVDVQFVMQHLILNFTSTTCPNCALMPPIILQLQESMPGQLHCVALHMGGKHCFSSLEGAMGKIANSLSSDSIFPSVNVNIHYPEGLKPTQTPTRIRTALNKSRRSSETGIAVESHVNGSDIDFTVKVKSVKTDNYNFFAFIVEDGVLHSRLVPDPTAEEGYSEVRDYVHDDVATYSLGNPQINDPHDDPRQGVSLGQIIRGKEVVRKFTIHTSEFDTRRTVNLSKCRIIGYTLRPNGVVDNVVNCPVNGTVHYQYVK